MPLSDILSSAVGDDLDVVSNLPVAALLVWLLDCLESMDGVTAGMVESEGKDKSTVSEDGTLN